MEPGRLPPQAVEVEQKVLSGMLLSRIAAGAAMEALRPEDFYRQAHAEIFTAMTELFKRDEPIDLITLTNELRKMSKLEMVGAESYLMELAESSVTAANIEYHAAIIKDKSTKRTLGDTCTNIVNRTFDEAEEVGSLISDAETEIYKISAGRIKQDFLSVRELLPKTFQDIELYGKSGVQGIRSGFDKLDELTSGFQNGNLIILAARPSVGKTALALSIAANAGIEGQKAVGIFSVEMTKEELVQRMLCAQAGINMHTLRSGRLSQRELPKLGLAAGPLSEARIHIDDSSSINMVEIRAKALRLKSRGALDILIVDYLQLIQGPAKMESREREISFISRGLKGLAKDLNIPVIALSQLSRRAEQRGDGSKPQLSDLRESGAIEQDADMVLFIFREKEEIESGSGKTEIIIGKQRNGPTGSVELFFNKDYVRFDKASFRNEEGVAFHA